MGSRPQALAEIPPQTLADPRRKYLDGRLVRTSRQSSSITDSLRSGSQRRSHENCQPWRRDVRSGGELVDLTLGMIKRAVKKKKSGGVVLRKHGIQPRRGFMPARAHKHRPVVLVLHQDRMPRQQYLTMVWRQADGHPGHAVAGQQGNQGEVEAYP